jgi:phosphoglycerate dehydrogenase-like enzyme
MREWSFGMVSETKECIRVLYNNVASSEIYDLMKSICPPGIELVFLDHDDAGERERKISDCRGVIVAATPLTASVVERAPGLELVQHQGVGYHDTVDVEALRRRGIRLALTSSVGATEAVAEHAVLLALAVIRRLSEAREALKRGKWFNNTVRSRSTSLVGKVIGYVGMGRIGQAAATRFAGFSTRGIYFDPYGGLSKQREKVLKLTPGSLDHVVSEADVLTLHVPLTETTRKMIGRRQLSAMKRGTILINTARGGLVDEDALVEVLENGWLGGAGLDVFEAEPLPEESRLRSLPNVVLTPHVSAATQDVFKEKMQRALNNISSYFAGKTLADEVPLTEKTG